ncbi:hypothetical protein Tco_1491635 [Tanacetum coccineum]
MVDNFTNQCNLKKAQSEKPCLYDIPYDTSDLANRFAPDREETMTLDNESRSKLDKDTVKPYAYTRQNSLYEIFQSTLTRAVQPRSSMSNGVCENNTSCPVSMLVMTSVHISSCLVLYQMTSDHNRSELGIHDHSNEPSSSKLVPKVVPTAVKDIYIMTRVFGNYYSTTYSHDEDNRPSDAMHNPSHPIEFLR